mmetsp:Transcript_11349/g.32467  ORF Transcript_11349/g.32467 Transcript_11349/m.32467 type:complete len:100 (-) Transcript_11349:109-408(-)
MDSNVIAVLEGSLKETEIIEAVDAVDRCLEQMRDNGGRIWQGAVARLRLEKEVEALRRRPAPLPSPRTALHAAGAAVLGPSLTPISEARRTLLAATGAT